MATIYRKTSTILLASICLFATSQALAQTGEPDNCAVPESWFSDGIPDPQVTAKTGEFNAQVVAQKKSFFETLFSFFSSKKDVSLGPNKDFPFQHFCDFNRWSWNAFLWSMEEQNGKARFMSFPTMEDTINETYGVPNQSNLLTLHPRSGKKDHPIDSIAQAGTEGILVAQNGRAVYYSQHISPQMYNQVVTANWNTASGLRAEDKTATFDVGNIEYKAAWAIVDKDFSIPGAYTRTALVPQLENIKINGIDHPGVSKDPVYKEENVALVGLHVVGWIQGHTEAVWASFSPNGLVPILEAENGVPIIKSNGSYSNPDQIISTSDTPFYTANTPLSACNQTQLQTQKLDPATQTFSLTTQSCQIYNTGAVDPTNDTVLGADTPAGKSITQINLSAASVIPSGTIGENYYEVGAVWAGQDKCSTTGPNGDNCNPTKGKLGRTFQDNLIGSNVLSNPVIETFTQTGVNHNCFTCHNSQNFNPSDPNIEPLQGSMLNLSHFLMQIYVDTYDETVADKLGAE